MHYYLPRSASWIEEMEKRSRRRTRDLVALAASQGLSENEIGCARISMMARSTNAPCKGRIQKRKTTLHLLKSGLQRTAGPYKSATAVTQLMQQQEKTARRRLVVLFAERDLESIQPAAVTKRNVVTQRANVPCEYRTSPRRRHASSIGAIGSRPHALCSRAS
jgi:hypothetical protein